MNTQPITWLENAHCFSRTDTADIDAVLPRGTAGHTREFHRQIPGYRISPLVGLPRLAARLGVGGIWVKDESQRMEMNSFKVLGGSYAIYRLLNRLLHRECQPWSFAELTSPAVRAQLPPLTFATATDGNHGRGVAWAAAAFGHRAVVYVHHDTSAARIEAIARYGAAVEVVDGTYDDAVRKVNRDAQANGWQVISDTSWPGYEEIPAWVMQGYTTMFAEAQEQLSEMGIAAPTHLFVQAGVGALAAAAIGYYCDRYGHDAPCSVVVEPATAACLQRSAQAAGEAPRVFPGGLQTIMAGLACGEPSPLAWRLLRNHADMFVACPDYVAATGMRVYGVPLQGDPFIVSGESGAVTLGALLFIMNRAEAEPLRRQLGLGLQSQILLINTEGNTDPEHFREVVWNGAEPVPERYRFATGRSRHRNA